MEIERGTQVRIVGGPYGLVVDPTSALSPLEHEVSDGTLGEYLGTVRTALGMSDDSGEWHAIGFVLTDEDSDGDVECYAPLHRSSFEIVDPDAPSDYQAATARALRGDSVDGIDELLAEIEDLRIDRAQYAHRIAELEAELEHAENVLSLVQTERHVLETTLRAVRLVASTGAAADAAVARFDALEGGES